MKRVLVTGASKGIGRAIAEILVSKNYEVIGTCRNPESLTDKVTGVKYEQLDLTCEESIKSCAQRVGGVDVLINNAGQSQLGSAEDTPIEEYKALFQVNFFGMAQLTSLLIPHMREQRSGTIINVGSLIASFPIAYYTSYTSSKAATQGYSLALSMELKPFNIDVTVVEPNDVKTSIKPKLTEKEDSAYKDYHSLLLKNVEQCMDEATPASKIASQIVKIIEKKRVKPFYSFGLKSKLLLFGKRFTSQSFVNKNVYKQYGFENIEKPSCKNP